MNIKNRCGCCCCWVVSYCMALTAPHTNRHGRLRVVGEGVYPFCGYYGLLANRVVACLWASRLCSIPSYFLDGDCVCVSGDLLHHHHAPMMMKRAAIRLDFAFTFFFPSRNNGDRGDGPSSSSGVLEYRPTSGKVPGCLLSVVCHY